MGLQLQYQRFSTTRNTAFTVCAAQVTLTYNVLVKGSKIKVVEPDTGQSKRSVDIRIQPLQRGDVVSGSQLSFE